jgi:hypothetical protein
MSIKSTLPIALVLVACSLGSTAFAQGVAGVPATGIRSDIGSGSARTPLYYDAQGGRHVGMINPQALGRVASNRGAHAFAQAVPFAGRYDSERDMRSPSSLDYTPDLNSR